MTPLLTAIALLCLTLPALAQGNGHLQLHFMDVGQGDGAVLITPQGQTVLFDNGVLNLCSRPVAYLQRLGVTRIDYHIASHYHADHIGCTREVLSVFPLQHVAFDRGGSYTTQTYGRYVATVGDRRQTVPVGYSLPLDSGVVLDFIAANGAGVPGADDENDLSVVVRVRYGDFDAVLGGDLSGSYEGGYADVETTVAPLVGQVEVYKVNHHGSRFSSNVRWLAALQPKIGIVSMSATNTFGHPTAQTMTRLHAANVQTYWTSAGRGVPPDPRWDFVGGDIVIDAPGGSTFTVRAAGQTHSYSVWINESAPPGPPDAPQNLAAQAIGAAVTLHWQPPATGPAPASYIVEVAAVAGGPTIAAGTVTGTTLTVPNAPFGVYYVRVRGVNGQGPGAASNEILVIVPGLDAGG